MKVESRGLEIRNILGIFLECWKTEIFSSENGHVSLEWLTAKGSWAMREIKRVYYPNDMVQPLNLDVHGVRCISGICSWLHKHFYNLIYCFVTCIEGVLTHTHTISWLFLFLFSFTLPRTLEVTSNWVLLIFVFIVFSQLFILLQLLKNFAEWTHFTKALNWGEVPK